ncbi:RmlC-like cupin domain-containing protein, partial [Gamsiella multidivaricata]|uniref:RmlC-like cupin domain-containing protein n=1 Tax=Gamsiella multidivaricata TaxID=101098 RepID=UPI002220B238
AEGVGTMVQRSIGGPDLESLDPFLTLDEFRIKNGFPDHPHRGFETVTLMLKGHFQHEDFAGHKGRIGPGDVQWMTAGRGIVHAEMPLFLGEDEEEDAQDIWGLQLWINLPKEHKLCKPQYQEFKDERIPRWSNRKDNDIEVKVIAGESHGVRSKVYTRTPTQYLEINMKRNQVLREWIPETHEGFVYVLQGRGRFGENGPVEGLPQQLLILESTSASSGSPNSDEPLHMVLVTGEPCREPVFRQGPFVMASKDELERTFRDYEEKKRGFERAQGWKSSIG